MTDARYPERWLNDRRIQKLSDSAHRTFVTLMTWSVSNRSDGQFDADDVAFTAHAKADDFEELYRSNLLTKNGNGWLLADFEETQTTAASLKGAEAARRHEREKKARQRAHAAGDHSLCRPDTCPLVPGDVLGEVLGDTKARQDRQDRPGATTGAGTKTCPHNVPNGDQPDPFVGGDLCCTQCRAEAKAAS